MKLTFDEKKILYTWGCPVYKNTVTRLAFAAAYKWIDGEHNEYDLLSSAYISALNIADVMGCESIPENLSYSDIPAG